MSMSLGTSFMRDGDAMLKSATPRMEEPGMAEQWARVRARLQAEVGDVEYRTWLKQVVFAGAAGDEVTVMLPTRFLRDWVNKEYGELLSTLWQAENPAIRRVEFRTAAASLRGAAPNLAEPRQPRPRRPRGRAAAPGKCRGARPALHLRDLRRRQA